MAKQPGHPSERWPETWRLHADLPPAAAALLKGAALDMSEGPARQAMEDLAGLLIAERAWLGLYAEGGVVKAHVDEVKAGEHMEAAERFEALWGGLSSGGGGRAGSVPAGQGGLIPRVLLGIMATAGTATPDIWQLLG